MLACCILHNWILGFGIDQVVPPEEGFTGSQPDPLENLPNNAASPKTPMSWHLEGMPSVMLCGKGGVPLGYDHTVTLLLNSVCLPCYGTHVCVMFM